MLISGEVIQYVSGFESLQNKGFATHSVLQLELRNTETKNNGGSQARQKPSWTEVILDMVREHIHHNDKNDFDVGENRRRTQTT